MEVGLTGALASGKTTLFELLSRARGAFLSPDQANTAAVDVPDPRLARLAEIFQPKKVTCAKIRFTDTNHLAPGQRENNNKSLNHLKLMDALAVVVDGFSAGRTGAAMAADLEFCLSELVLSDLEQVEKKLERVRRQAKPALLAGRSEQEVFASLAAALEANRFLATLDLDPAARKELNSFSFLTFKPAFAVANLSEAAGAEGPAGLADFEARASALGLPVVRVWAKLERDLQDLPEGDREVFQAEYALPLDGKSAFIREAYRTAGLVSFLTVGSDEVRAWTVRRDCPAQEAGAAIHKDFMQYFVRAEVVPYPRLVEAGSLAEAARRGWLRSEKKEYPVQDGDVINFLSSK